MTTAPTSAFAHADLDNATVAAGEPCRRIWLAGYPDPLGYGKGRSRFSDPRRRVQDNNFGVLYLGSSLKVCFLEVILRDQRDGLVDTFPLRRTI